MSANKGIGADAYWEAYQRLGSVNAVSRELNVTRSTVQAAIKRKKNIHYGTMDSVSEADVAEDRLVDLGYNTASPDLTPQAAWDQHVNSFEMTLSSTQKNQWSVIERGPGPYVVAHFTDPHVDDNGTPLRLLEADIKASHEMGAIKCHGGDLLNNWPLAGKLAKQWAKQECTLPAAILRAKHYIDILQPNVWVDGNHEEMNGGAYLERLFGEWLSGLDHEVIRDYWTARFTVKPEGGREVRFSLSHKFQKGRSWFHPHHGVIREAMQGEDADIYMEGHLHASGIIYHTMPERQKNVIGVSSAGYKMLDNYAARISLGGVIPKFKGRCHWIVCDDQADESEWPAKVFDSAKQAEAYLSGLHNLRAV